MFNNSDVSTEDTVRLTQQINAGRHASKLAPMRSIVLGTAGHIDHGKTSLVFALTGTDTDRLPEEKSRGITIDLGFAAMRFQEERIELSLVDVPGHHAFVRNMLAGAGGIDCVMLVIAADDGVKPQTTEHLAICTLLGVRHGIVVLTKKDAVSAEHLQRSQRRGAAVSAKHFLTPCTDVDGFGAYRRGHRGTKGRTCALGGPNPGAKRRLLTPVAARSRVLDEGVRNSGYGNAASRQHAGGR